MLAREQRAVHIDHAQSRQFADAAPLCIAAYVSTHTARSLSHLQQHHGAHPGGAIVGDPVIARIKKDVSPSTAKSCRSVISGVLGMAVRYGAVTSNPVREVERIEMGAKKAPRGLTEEERVAWLTQLWNDEKAIRKDLPDLTFFMLATGVRIGEVLAAIWSDVDFEAGTVAINHTPWSGSKERGC